MEAHGPALLAVAHEVLDEPEPDVAGVDLADGVELDDRPLVALALALDAEQAGHPPVLLEHIHEIVRAERTERQPEQVEHPDGRTRHGQPERARLGPVGLAQARQLAERGQVGQPRQADLARPDAHRSARSRRVG